MKKGHPLRIEIFQMRTIFKVKGSVKTMTSNKAKGDINTSVFK